MLIYRLLMVPIALWLIGLTLIQHWRGHISASGLAERLGYLSPRHTADRAIWLHGASNGELASAKPVLLRLLTERPKLQVLITANTGTAVAMVQAWNLPRVEAALSPVDGFGAPGRILRRWRPSALILVESELWPARLAAASAAGVPVALMGARLSARSARLWSRIAPGLMRQGLARLAFASAQDTGSAARLVELGLPVQNLATQVMLKAQMAAVTEVAGPLPRPRVLLAASTHPGEEATILTAFAKARGQFDLLILAPRHPRRSSEVAGLIAAAGFDYSRRSEGAMPQAGVPVFLADTMGEMALWYGMAGATVIGGSFVPLGGHTPYEPVAAGSAVLHGPHMENFSDAAATLAKADAAVRVGSADLAEALCGLNAERQAALAQAARAALRPMDGIDALMERLLALVPPD